MEHPPEDPVALALPTTARSHNSALRLTIVIPHSWTSGVAKCSWKH